MKRDNLKSTLYFENYISEQNKRIDKFEKILHTIPNSENMKKVQCKKYIANFCKNLINAEYSIGKSKEQIKQTFEKYIKLVYECGEIEYAELIDILAIAIILETDVEIITEMDCVNSLKDGLICYLMNYIMKSNNQVSNELFYEKYYSIFMRYAVDEVSADEFINYVNNEWYIHSDEFAWFESDKSDENTYVGYWCWLSAALLKMKEINIKGKFIPNNF